MGLSVLVVDDSPSTRFVIERVVRRSGKGVDNCHHAANGYEALRILNDRIVDAIFVDLNMPLMDGREFLRRVRGDERYRELPVAVVSSLPNADTEMGLELQALGVQGIYKKPITPEMLHDVFLLLKGSHA